MGTQKNNFLDPLVLARIAGLKLRAQLVVEGFIAGLHQSSYRGYSLEFAQHREYVAGDELRHLDWKVYGRTDRFFIKQFEEETNLRVYLLLDASASMGFKGQNSALSKYDYGATLLASVAYLTLRQQDSVGLACLREFGQRLIPAQNSSQHLNVVLDELESVKPQGEGNLGKSLESVAFRANKRSLFILVSDLFDSQDSLINALKFLRFKKHEVMVVHLLDSDEQRFPYTGSVEFESLENQEKMTLETDSYRTEYLRAMDEFMKSAKASLQSSAIQYCFSTTQEPIDRLMRRMLIES